MEGNPGSNLEDICKPPPLQPCAGAMDQLMMCLEMGKAITSTLDMAKIVETIFSTVSRLLPATNWSLLLLDEEQEVLFFELSVGLERDLLKNIRIPLGQGIAGTVALTGEPMIVPEATKDPHFSPMVDQLSGFQTHSLICLPLKIRGKTIGVVEIVNPSNDSLLEPQSLTILSILADYMAIAIANAANYRKIASLALTDTVTGYYNTRFLHEFLDKLVAGPHRTVSLVFMDMDDFKRVVDVHGHLAGSKVLKEVADTLVRFLRPGDALVRYGGDEFVILLENCDKDEALARVQEMAREIATKEFLKEEGRSVRTGASFGVATYPHDATTKEELLRLADWCMFRSKESGKGRITICTMASGIESRPVFSPLGRSQA